DAMRRGDHEIHGQQPGFERKMRAVERGPRGDAGPIPAAPASELTRTWGEPTNELVGAALAVYSVRLSGGLEPSPTRDFRAEPVKQPWQRPVVHDYNLPDSASIPESDAARQ